MAELVAPLFGKFTLGDSIISGGATISTTRAGGTGTIGEKVFYATGAFSPGQVVRIHSAVTGKKERNMVRSYSTGEVQLMLPLANSYGSRSQIIVVPEYRKLTINNGVTWLVPAWSGATDGIIEICADELIINGTLSADGKGLRGGGGVGNNQSGFQGEGNTNTGGQSASANENAGGGGVTNNAAGGGGNHESAATQGAGGSPGLAGNAVGDEDLEEMFFGGSGGSGSNNSGAGLSGAGGNGGGSVIINARKLLINNSTGLLTANGNDGGVSSGSDGSPGSGGAGAGGSILIRALYADIGTNLLKANGGAGGVASGGNIGGTGGKGRIRLEVGQLVGSTNQGDVSVVEGGQSWQGKLGL
jgi:hypothetical protein